MNLEINVVRGRKAVKLLNTEDFISRWKELAEIPNKVTVFQEPLFVQNWYKQYADIFEPVMLVGYDENSKIVGLIPLAFSSKNNTFHHAGGSQAEYHGWLCEPMIHDHFLIKSLCILKDHFKLRTWQWGWTPPRSDVKWLFSNELKKAGVYVKTYMQEAPVLNLLDSDLLDKLKKSRSLKTKLNRFKRRENFHIERITSKEKAKEIFDILAMQCDFRQMAANESSPFTNDPIKKPFHIEKLNSPSNVHFTVLWANHHPVAYNFGECDSETVYLGVMSYDPLDGKNSPGIIFLMQLAELLKEEGYHYFDLTPGGDQYKQKFCNMTQKVYLPTFYFNKKDKIISDTKEGVKRISKNTLRVLGLDITAKPNKLIDFIKQWKNTLKTSPSNLIKRLFSTIYQTDTVLLYKITTDQITESSFSSADDIAINKYADLLLYTNTTKGLEKKRFFSNALKRFERENVLYSHVDQNLLSHYCWVIQKSGKQLLTEVEMEFITPENSVYIDDYFTQTDFEGNELLSKSLSKIFRKSKTDNIHEIFIKVPPDDIDTQQLIKSIGFSLFRTYEKKRILWWANKQET